MKRARQITLVVGICVSLAGGMLLPFPQTNPEALTQSLFVRLAAGGLFTRPGIIIVGIGLVLILVSVLLPKGDE